MIIIDVVTLALAKKYTEATVAGVGAIKEKMENPHIKSL